MAFTPSSFLNNTSNVIFRDQQHAARTFTDDQFRLAPKHKFLFHVAFSINQAALADVALVQRHRNEINMLVKSCDLPNFSVQSDTLNQYNRKKNVQYQIKYQPLNITFHDDNLGIINALWQNYYSYYYADAYSAGDPGAYNRTATKNSNFINNLYGLDNGSNIPFFNYITIYQMARHEYVSYKLINPIITQWNHNRVDYSQPGIHDNTMQIQYESVLYGQGEVIPGDPEGFALEHYDKTPSPLAGQRDGGTANPSSINKDLNKLSILNTLTEQINTYQNTKDNQTTGLQSDIANLKSQVQGVSGLQGFSFPSTPNTTAITAKQVKI